MDADDELLGPAMIIIDATKHSTVVVCTDCQVWAVGALSREEGARLAADHEARSHPETTRARDRARLLEWRATRR